MTLGRFAIAFAGIVCVGASLHAQGPAAPVAARDLPRGVELTAADLSGDTTAASMVGWVTRRVIRAGEQLKEPAVEPPQLVRAGSEVVVRAEYGGVVVTRPGTALASGSLGDRVRVRLDVQHTITGIVASRATVRIP